ncbi:hypothetical protein F3Y22_tig00110864pilonHSYRG00459 [Hibiscus syriacus]|uniref:Uncharacterized protein n=1 Tax=Hibiscus syriacus TaxID=106335 RepID=A0A6A2ZJD1_HIBSY|nr:hypothetical protein F3Y22_tig00110864pilonHSYRG00459 [Hibiscus syriacus]
MFGRETFHNEKEPDTALQLDFSNVRHELPWWFDWFLNIDDPSYSNLFSYKQSSFLVTVKTLHLKSVSCTFSRVVSSMMNNFKFLESSTIENCHGLRALTLDASACNSRLKKLTILDCNNWNLSVSKLTACNRFDFETNCKALIVATRDLNSFRSHVFDHVAFITVADITDVIAEFKCLTELWWTDYAKNRFNGDALISSLKHCPRLTRLYITIDPKSYRRTNTMCDYSVEVASVPLKDLKVVKLEGFPMRKKRFCWQRG